jgi:alpha-amylase
MSNINGTMMQFFHWYIPPDGNHWENLKNSAQELADAGITGLWLPPAYKASGGGYDVGYGVYDLFDLGEFDQKGSVRTKYGTKEQYIAAIKAAQAAGMQVYADGVFNHKNGGDEVEAVEAIPVAFDNRNYEVGGLQTIKIWTHFNFPGRGDKYSSMKWHWWHFDSVNHNSDRPGDSTIYRLKDKQFETGVDPRLGNYDFLMACDLDMGVDQVRGELKYWGEWFLNTTGVDGFRLDAVKHIRAWFFNEWLDHLRHYTQRNLFAVGEYWADDIEALHWFIKETGGRMALFDVPLHYNFHRASKSGGHYDMRRILDGTLTQQQPALACTFVDNHDSQPLQALESWVESWFKPLAYAIILLRREGYPCVFYADYYGAHYRDRGRDGSEYEIWLDSHQWIINKLLDARQHYAYGDQYTYFDHPDLIGWTRLGDETHPKAMAVLLSDGAGGSKWMEVGRPNTTFRDLTEHIKDPIRTNEWGWGEFYCNGGSVSVWVQE